MVDKKEIEHLSDLVKIEIKDPQKYILQVEQILNYFERLDKVEITASEASGLIRNGHITGVRKP